MHASIRRYTMAAGSMDSLMHRIAEEFAPALRQERGFVGYLAVDTGESTYETISVFTNAESAERSEELAATYTAENLGEFGVTLTQAHTGEVLAGRVAPGMLENVHRWRSPRARERLGEGADQRPVLVVGATGRTGRRIVERLVERGLPVRAVVRDPARARDLLPAPVTLAAGDLREPATLAEPMRGARAMIVATSAGADRDNSAILVDYFGTRSLIEHAAGAGVGLLVFVSSIHVSRPEHYQDVEPTSLGWKARAEELIRSSPLEYCIVRAGWLVDGDGGEPLAVSQGDTAEGQLSRADLADVCVRVLDLEDARGKTFEVVAGADGDPGDLESAIAGLAADRDVAGVSAVGAG